MDMSSLSLPATVSADPGLLYPGVAYDRASNPGVGLMLYRSSFGSGRFEAGGISFLWDYGSAGVEAIGEFVDLRLIGIEMVYVPEGSYYLGSGGEEAECFSDAEGGALEIGSEGALTLGSVSLPAAFPKGYGGFYGMKYELGNGLYDLFLEGTGRPGLPSGSDLSASAGNLDGAEGLLLADWLGLRPMTELEYEKAARGVEAPVANEYAWGDTVLTVYRGLARAPEGNSRLSSGASYWGLMGLSGGVWESCVGVDSPEGQAFDGSHGDGNLGSTAWSGLSGGIGLRGGSNQSEWGTLRVSDRSRSSGGVSDRGFRLVRTAQSVSLPTVSTVSASVGASNSAAVSGNVSDDGGSMVTSRGIVWSASPAPDLTDNNSASGTGTGAFTVSIDIKTLDLATTYYVRAYATNAAGTAYGVEQQLTTPDYFPLVKVAGGTFDMGCTPEQGGDCFPNESPVQDITLSSYMAGKYEVSQLAWEWVMGSNPSYFGGCGQCPVESVSWDDAQNFIKALNFKTGRNYRLPTEAEWEFAARGGNASQSYKYAGGNTLDLVAWYYDNSVKPQIAGQKTANELGLYDMTGNVWEWCKDYYGDYTAGAQTDPQGPGSGTLRVLRGGSYASLAIVSRIPARYPTSSSYDDIEFGLRLFHDLDADTLASVQTNPAAEITATGALISGEVTDNGTSLVTDRGLVWSTSPNPDLSDNFVSLGSGKGTFEHTLTGLSSLSRYYVRAYATNAFGTAYGSEVVFITRDAFEMKLVPGGSFTMGCTTEQGGDCDGDESPSHVVAIDSFLIGKYEVTQAQWESIMGSNPSTGAICGTCPVEGISWEQAKAFVDTINNRSSVTYRLPTEAEWEFAARGGLASGSNKYAGSNTVGAVAWYQGNAGGIIKAVGGKQANELGIYDLSGNAMEWVSDWYDSGYYGASPGSNPGGPASGTEKVLRGGYWNDPVANVRTAARHSALPTANPSGAGLRLARDVSLPVLSTTAASAITDSSATSGGTFTSTGNSLISTSGVVWNTTGGPTIASNKTSDGALSGSFTSALTGLQGGTTYYVRAYAVHETGVAYGNEVSFTTLAGEPAVTTAAVEVLSSSKAKLGGQVVSDGGATVTDRGVVWGTSPGLSLSNNKIAIGTGTGIFSTLVDTLTANTTYYVRAYAINSEGTVYGEELSFMTAVDLPSVTTSTLQAFPDGSFFGGGEVLSDGGGTVTARGLVWGTDSNPTLPFDSYSVKGSGTGAFNEIISRSSLSPGTTFYVRAYATNSAGTAYGNEVTADIPFGMPEVETGTVRVEGISVGISGNVVSDGGAPVSSRGVVYGTAPSPSINGDVEGYGSGLGRFEVDLINLNPATTYYARTYATNIVGTSYGAEVSFTTPAAVPSIKFDTLYITSRSTAFAEAQILDDGGATVTEMGFVWSTSPEPDTMAPFSVKGAPERGGFSSVLSNLSPGITYYVRAYAKNSAGINYVGQKVLEIPVQLPVLTTIAITSISGNTAQSGGKVSDDGGAQVTERGLVWSTAPTPDLSDFRQSNGSGTGTFTITLGDLATFTKYYVRAYATNSVGTAYGQERSFTTAAGAPSVRTGEISDISATTALGDGEVLSDGGASVTQRGLVWATTPNPDLNDFSAKAGTGTGVFTAQLKNLSPGTTYYVRAYAKNAKGTTYGAQTTFTTGITLPEVLTVGLVNVLVNRATLAGRVASNGGGVITGRGMVWSEAPEPTLDDQVVESGTSLGDFEVMLSNLKSDTPYFVRAWAKNEAGVAYGQELNFVTLTALNLEFVSVQGGTFTMGCTPEQGSDCDPNESPSHAVTLKNYYIGKYEITENDWIRVMGSLPTTASVCGNCPVTYVTWRDAQRFIAQLNEETGLNYRLPTEAEWEYAARGGINRQGRKYAGSNEVTSVAWHSGDGVAYVQPVGQKAANELGLYDMSGNVWEWCSDYFGDYSVGSVSNPTGPSSGELRVLRGGSWNYPATASRVSARGSGFPNASGGFPNGFTGFRLAINTFDPEIETIQIEAITDSSASVVFEVSSLGRNGIAEMGIVWGSEADPVLSDHANIVVADYVSKGSFTLPLTGLSPFTPYYLRAYARNDQETVYGQTLKFQTLAAKPVVETKLSDIFLNGARVSGEVLTDKGASILEQGIVWSTAPLPDLSGHIIATDTSTTSFELTLDQLSPLTKYYVRAFARNAIGVGYGAEISFITPMVFGGVSMVMVPGGTFLMGCDTGDCDSDEQPVHEVTLDTFFMAQFELTQAEWKAITGKSPSLVKNCDDCPVERINWEQVNDFIENLNSKTGYSFRLPTEAEWEFAARGGNGSRGYAFSGSNDADSVAWYLANSSSTTHVVGTLQPNELGIYDMTGNVLEWCSDHNDGYDSTPQNNPNNVSTNTIYRIIRGGSWYSLEKDLRLTWRAGFKNSLASNYIGFRLVRPNTPRVPVLPVVRTSRVSNITSNSAIIESEVLDDGGADITERGVVWSTKPNPNLNDAKVADLDPKTGAYTSKIEGLVAETKYYLRAYAKNEAGTVYGNQTTFTTLWDYSVDMVKVEGGSFIMGCNRSEQGADCLLNFSENESPKRMVTLSSFYMGVYEVTQDQWMAVMGYNPSNFKDCGNCPVEKVSWNEVHKFITKLNEITGLNYRLPTEAEWEYAARGGANSVFTTYSGSNEIRQVAWYGLNSGRKTHIVGQLKPNKLGIYDMSGNVSEWCSDWFGQYPFNPETDPQGPLTGDARINRGCAWSDDYTKACRITYRGYGPQNLHDYSVGFRLVRPID
jgi:formylglycine-generating enzyme required for sulfatase activity